MNTSGDKDPEEPLEEDLQDDQDDVDSNSDDGENELDTIAWQERIQIHQ